MDHTEESSEYGISNIKFAKGCSTEKNNSLAPIKGSKEGWSFVPHPKHLLLEKFRPVPINLLPRTINSCREGQPHSTFSVAKLLWDGGTLSKVPFRIPGHSKKRFVRLKHGGNERSKLQVSLRPPTAGSTSPRFAAYPLCIEWGDPKCACPNEIFLKDVKEIRFGRQTSAFLAYLAWNGNKSLPDDIFCFSVVSADRTIDFMADTTHEATSWRDALSSLMLEFQRWKTESPSILPTPPSPFHRNRWDPELHKESFFAAVKNADVEVFKWHLEQGCAINFMEETTGDTALTSACRLGRTNVVELALKHGAKNDPHPDFGQTALQVAVLTGHADCTRLILETAAPSQSDIIISNHADGNGEAPIHVASRCGNLGILELLVLHGANIRLLDSAGRTSLHCAAQGTHPDCLRYLLDVGGDSLVEERDDRGRTCLHVAIGAGNVECVRVLLEAAADVQAATFHGITAVEQARLGKSQQVIKVMEEYDVSLEDQESPSLPYSGLVSEQDEKNQPNNCYENADLFDGLDVFKVSFGLSSMQGNTIANARLQNYTEIPPGRYDNAGTNACLIARKSLLDGDLADRRTRSSEIVRCSDFSDLQGPDQYEFHQCDQESSYVRFNQQWRSGHYNESINGGYNCSGLYNSIEEFDVHSDIWQVFYDSGYPYYMRVKDGHSQWEDPRQHLASEKTMINTEDSASRLNHIILSPQKYEFSNDIDAKYSNDPNSGRHDKSRTSEAGLQPVSNISASPPSINKNKVEKGEDKKEMPHLGLTSVENDVINAELSTANSKKLVKYTEMVSVGVPIVAAEKKMKQDGVSPSAISQLLSSAGCGSKYNQQQSTHKIKSQSGTSDIQKAAYNFMPLCIEKKAVGSPKSQKDKKEMTEDPILAKYIKMISVGVPLASVLHKMKVDGVCQSKIQAFEQANGVVTTRLHQDAGTVPMPPAPSIDLRSNISKDDLMSDAVLSKYTKMASMGVPPSAVLNKLRMDDIDGDKIALFKLIFDLETDVVGQERKFRETKGLLLPPQPVLMRKASIKLQKIHWKPVAEEKLQDSLWARGNSAESDVDQVALKQLESLFGAKPSNNLKEKKLSTGKAKKEVRLIELKRANNVAISLAQFRSFRNFDDLCKAVVTQDDEKINVEKLLNLQALLPTPQELDSIKRHSSGIEGLGSAELFFLSVSKFPRFAFKLQSFLSSLQFSDQVQETSETLDLLGKACTEVVESQKLASMLRKLLVVGNIMNGSVGTPKAAGITLDSLLKTANKRGSDGETTVLDYVVATLIKQGDKNNIIDFWQSMPSVREASRMDVREIRSSIKELQWKVNSVQTGFVTEDKNIQEGPAIHDTRKFIDKSNSFIEKATLVLKDLSSKLQNIEVKACSLCSFFAEDTSTCQSSSIFEVLLSFSKLVEKSKESLERKERIVKRRAQMNTPIRNSRGTSSKPKYEQDKDVGFEKSDAKQKMDGQSLLLQSISQRRLSSVLDNDDKF